MAFSWGSAAGGASDALQQLLARRMEEQLAQARLEAQQQQMAQQASQFNANLGMQQKQFEAGEKERTEERAYRGRQETRGDTALRKAEGKEAAGSMILEGLMGRTREGETFPSSTTPAEAQRRLLAQGIQIPMDVLDPELGNREWERREGIEHKNRLGEIGAQAAGAERVAGVRSAGTRDAATQRRIDAKAKGFDAQPAVKRAVGLAEAASFAAGINPNTTNPADDQALIYNFAKSMDPDSAVREGEYATIQKYAQSLAEHFGFNAARVFSNTTFLTPEARKNLKDTILSRFEASRTQYDTIRKSYADRLTGMGGDEGDLTDYGTGFPSGGGGVTPPKVGEKKTFPNGRTATFDGTGWVAD